MNKRSHYLAGVLERRVGVGFDQVRTEVCVQHEVEAEELESELLSSYFRTDRHDHIVGNEFHLFVGIIEFLFINADLAKVFFEPFKSHLRLKFLTLL